MSTLLKRILSTSLCVTSFFMFSATAQQITPGGIIHFRGAIVESPCEVNSQQQQIELSCIRDGKLRSSRYNTQQIAMAPESLQQIASVKMQYLNEQKNLAILNIEYK
ncbi:MULTISPECIES: type 1 fimbrial protein [Citrobacter]|uniref:type 1 fimbrial protein n=1 Tax=Citrobacter TaxID=544 RepID=UPI0017FC405F|nr:MULTISPECIES: type 1 fimbrial protein [unclassified Citrobacter]HCJ6375267.1 type 1 fimbrial protein [Citrobacter freundii]MBA7966844.1 type 1 fimbrial protein [Citrobacter sp. RHBSTW-00671]MDW2642077.1 type 1 fimbrial protein [Citrobacter sp. HN-141]MDW2654224.1 type 1 fimbrial protein [Citrobacter sp. HN-120]MDW2697249.1 type 1 fimbrial protein [Citrobacter sp. HN-144]